MIERRPPTGVPAAVVPAPWVIALVRLTLFCGFTLGRRGSWTGQLAGSAQAQIHRLEPCRQRIGQRHELPVGRDRDAEPHPHQRALGHADNWLPGLVVLVPPFDLNPLLIGCNRPLARGLVYRRVEKQRRGAGAGASSISRSDADSDALAASTTGGVRDRSGQWQGQFTQRFALGAIDDLIPPPHFIAALRGAGLARGEVRKRRGRGPAVLRIPVTPTRRPATLLD